MNRKEKLKFTEEFLRKGGWDAEAAKGAAEEALDEGTPLVESLCFKALAEHVLAKIHSSTWIKNRAKIDGYDVIKRLLDSGASVEDLAVFARLMQREYLSNLGCILDGAGIGGTPELPFEDFRIFAVDDAGKPLAEIPDLHEMLSFCDWETEMKQSREADA